MKETYIVSGARTPIGDFGGSFRSLLSYQMAVVVINEAIKRAGIEPGEIDDVILGNCAQRSDEPNVARTAALYAGLPIEVTGMTIQRQCASGMQAIISGSQQIATGDSEVVLAEIGRASCRERV